MLWEVLALGIMSPVLLKLWPQVERILVCASVSPSAGLAIHLPIPMGDVRASMCPALGRASGIRAGMASAPLGADLAYT